MLNKRQEENPANPKKKIWNSRFKELRNHKKQKNVKRCKKAG